MNGWMDETLFRGTSLPCLMNKKFNDINIYNTYYNIEHQ
jgi:hypothetical protein